MLTKTLAIMLAASFVAAPSFASTLFKYGTRDNPSLKMSSHKPFKAQASNNYTDFSGIWKGKCTNQDEPEVITIKNDEVSFKVDEKVYEIGASLATHSNGYSWMTESKHETLFWNENKTQIIMNGTDVMRFHPDYVDRYSEDLLNTLTMANVSIVDEKLVVEQKVHFYQGVKKMDEENFVCTYVRDQF